MISVLVIVSLLLLRILIKIRRIKNLTSIVCKVPLPRLKKCRPRKSFSCFALAESTSNVPSRLNLCKQISSLSLSPCPLCKIFRDPSRQIYSLWEEVATLLVSLFTFFLDLAAAKCLFRRRLLCLPFSLAKKIPSRMFFPFFDLSFLFFLN